MNQKQESPRFVLVIHGGAGTISRVQMTPRREARHRVALTAALQAGYAVLEGVGAASMP